MTPERRIVSAGGATDPTESRGIVGDHAASQAKQECGVAPGGPRGSGGTKDEPPEAARESGVGRRRAALAYRGEAIVAIETEHETHPENAERWRGRGDRVEILPVDEAIQRWRAGPIWEGAEEGCS